MDKTWLAEYDEGVPAEIDPSIHPSLKEVIEVNCARFSDRTAYSNMGVAITFADLDRLSLQFGAYLRSVAGLSRGDRVAIMLPNVLQYPIAVLGVLRAGLVVVNVNPMYTPRELKYQLEDSGARAILVMENFAATLQEVVDQSDIERIITTQLADMFPPIKRATVNFVVKRIKKLVPPFLLKDAVKFRDALKQGDDSDLPDERLTHEDIAFLQYTGGTTGVAKGAVLTHGNMVANVLQASEWLRPVTKEGEEVIVCALPLYHIFALLANCLTYMSLGGENLLITNPRDFKGFVKTLQTSRFTGILGVNTLFNSLLNTPGFAECDFRSLHVSLGGGMAVQRAVAEKWKAVTGQPLIEAYGLTETSPAACMNPMTNDCYNGSIGLPIPSTEVTIRDDDGNVLPIGKVGEICIQGPQVMREYWHRPKETENVMLDGRWLRTGDIGRLDERGYVFIEDRKKDMILVSGFNVYPNEVEAVAALHSGILEAAAVAMPDPGSGEVVKLFVVRNDPKLTEDHVIAHCRGQLSAYKVPKQVEFRDSLPKSNVGKILRRALKGQ